MTPERSGGPLARCAPWRRGRGPGGPRGFGGSCGPTTRRGGRPQTPDRARVRGGGRRGSRDGRGPRASDPPPYQVRSPKGQGAGDFREGALDSRLPELKSPGDARTHRTVPTDPTAPDPLEQPNRPDAWALGTGSTGAAWGPGGAGSAGPGPGDSGSPPATGPRKSSLTRPAGRSRGGGCVAMHLQSVDTPPCGNVGPVRMRPLNGLKSGCEPNSPDSAPFVLTVAILSTPFAE